MVHALQPETPHDWHEHPDGLDDVGQASFAAGGGNSWTQQVVKAENVRDVEILQPRPQITLYRRVPAHCPVTHPRRKINVLHAILTPPPAKWRPSRRAFFFRGL